jgi:hypothetical protein
MGGYVNDAYVEHVATQMDPSEMRFEAVKSYNRLKDLGKIQDPYDTLMRLMDQSCCFPTNSWVFSDGWYFLMALPSSVFTATEDASGNFVSNWDFFACEV